MRKEIKDILQADKKRESIIHTPFNPITGEGSTGDRKKVSIKGLPFKDVWLPADMLKETFIKILIKDGINGFLRKNKLESNETNINSVIEAFFRIRIKYDFPFWCATCVKIKPKGGGEDVPFILNRPQRKLENEGFENNKVLSQPVRLIIDKARQWGGSTCTQLKFAWLQMVHEIGLNSLICAHVKDTATEVLDMFNRMVSQYPTTLLYNIGESFDPNETKWQGVGQAQNIHRVPQRKCKIKIGSLERPDSCRGGDYNLVHCTEVGVWKKTEGKEPEDVIDAATGGMLYAPLTMVVYESTAKGTGNFFHREYTSAKKGESQFKAFFVAWYEIDQYSLPMSAKEKEEFATNLWENRNNKNILSDREESGKYLWWLWNDCGATLDAINWYVHERKKYRDHAHMASEYPSDDIESFVHSGARVFDKYKVDAFRSACRSPKAIGDVVGNAIKGKDAVTDVHFVEDKQGMVWIWEYPETFESEKVMNRYLVTVDIGGRSRKADYSVISVIDRYEMMEGGKPSIVAQWYGHTDHDLLAWKAAQVAKYYDDALLVIESNTLETKDNERDVDGDQSGFILNQIKDVYDNLYARQVSSENIKDGFETKYGFHTNTKTKPEIISNLIEIVREKLYVERDERCLDEFLTYEKAHNGSYAAIIGHHDDLLMTRAIGLWICFRVMDMPKFVSIKDKNMYYKKQIAGVTL